MIDTCPAAGFGPIWTMRSCTSPFTTTNACHIFPRFTTAVSGTIGRVSWLGEHAGNEVALVERGFDHQRSRAPDLGAEARDRRGVRLARLRDRLELDLLILLHRAHRGLGNRELDLQRVVVDEREQWTAGLHPVTGRDVLVADHALERCAHDAVLERLRHHAGARFGGLDLLQCRRALRALAVVLAARDRALVEQRLRTLALFFGELALRSRTRDVRLCFARAECGGADVESHELLALLHALTAIDHHTEDLAGGIGRDLEPLVSLDDAGQDDLLRRRSFRRDRELELERGWWRCLRGDLLLLLAGRQAGDETKSQGDPIHGAA
jgi:hypothetical protein